MTARETQGSATAGDVDEEAMRYLDVVNPFASLGADPHEAARTRTARARHNENLTRPTAQVGAQKGVRRWTR